MKKPKICIITTIGHSLNQLYPDFFHLLNDKGDEVVLSPCVVISTLVHGFKNGSTYGTPSDASPVRIGKGSWLAAHVSVRAGVTIGSGVLVAANAAVVKDVPDNVLVGEVPAKIIKERKDTDYNIRGRWLDDDQNNHLQNKPNNRSVEQER